MNDLEQCGSTGKKRKKRFKIFRACQCSIALVNGRQNTRAELSAAGLIETSLHHLPSYNFLIFQPTRLTTWSVQSSV